MLRFRLSLLVTATLLVSIFAFGVLAVVLFERLQYQQLEELLERDLEAVQALVEASVVGVEFSAPAGGADLQFVDQVGIVQVPADALTAIPLFAEPTLAQFEGRTVMAAAVPWITPGGARIGTIRIAYDAGGVAQARTVLVRSLVASGVSIALLALLLSLRLLRRALTPLQELAQEASGLDPANPVMTPVEGPDDEVQRVASALNRAIDAIRERQQSERDALAEVAHELAAPISVVAGRLTALAQESNDPRLLAAREAANELLYTSQDLLTLARGELELPLEMRALDLFDVAENIARQYPGVHLVGKPGAEVLGSSERLTQVVRNLVRNALQASKGKGVVIEVREVGESVELAVRDEGQGIDQARQERIFERYVSGSAGEGLGVGLTVARNIVQRHDGQLSVASSLGQGSIFTIRLPALVAQLEA